MVTANTPARIRDTLAKISLCRTAALGSHKFRCEDCHEVTYLYNSCGDRNCPQCSGSKRVEFNQHAAKRIIDGVVYYQVTMTLPSELSQLAVMNRELFAELLPRSAWLALRRQLATEQGYQAGAISVLHTWNQRLENHWHVHLLVPGAGPGIEQRRWVEAKPPVGHPNTDGFYLVDADQLRDTFRSRFIARLIRARAAGKLKLTGRWEYLQDDDNWLAFERYLKSTSWVAHIQAPPTSQSLAHHVVNYLTRYVTGGPISDRRIVSANIRKVTFLAREGKRAGGERKQVAVTLPTAEFTDRWSEHIMPAGLTKVRYFGGWSNNKVASYTKKCQELIPELDQSSDRSLAGKESEPSRREDLVCEHCGSDRLVLLERTSKPSWRDLLGYQSESVPWWYAEVRKEQDRQFWDEAMGSGFNDWYLETLIESAKEPAEPDKPLVQLSLLGLESVGESDSYSLNSF